MQVPLTVSFKDMPVSEPIRTACWSEAEKLEHYYQRITSCHVTVSQPARRHREGSPCAIHIRIAVPGDEIVVRHDPPLPRPDARPEITVRDAFDEARRRLQDYARRQRGDVKHHEQTARPPVAGETPPTTTQG